jgi:hypothetical protein
MSVLYFCERWKQRMSELLVYKCRWEKIKNACPVYVYMKKGKGREKVHELISLCM